MIRRIGGHRIAQVLAFVALLCAGCLGQETRDVFGPVISTVNFVAVVPGLERAELDEHSLLFSNVDAAREGIPQELKFEPQAGSTNMVAVVLFNKHILETPDDTGLIPCFEDPVRLRNDSTGEIVAELDDFCPPGTSSSTMYVEGLYDEREATISPP